MRTSKYLRKATRNFVCACCLGQINKGEEYIDLESVDHSVDDTILIKHKRIHKDCDKAKVKYSKDNLPMPVAYDFNKEMLVGKVVMGDDWFLLTQDWVMPYKYHKRTVVHDAYGNNIRPEDVEL